MSAVSSTFSISSKDDPSTSVEFTHDPCLSCADPCDSGHAQLPSTLASKIDQSEPLKGSVKPYTRHLMYCAGTGKNWPEKIEESIEKTPKENLVNALYKSIEEVNGMMGGGKKVGRTLMTAIDRVPSDDCNVVGSEDVSTVEVTEFLLFPDFVKVSGVNVNNVKKVLESWIKGEEKLASFDGVKVTDVSDEAIVLVCTHMKRDKRCGVAGPMLIEEFERVVEEVGLQGKVAIHGVSHIGGHKFAGNVIIYSKFHPNGLWYGRVKTCHVQSIVEGTVKEGKVFEPLYRGEGTPAKKNPGADKKW
ncbi:hypothetical protein HDU76_001575 [Blyttiomyces sp. JEL0837]|nr:hypothetical protein HDU76_001575 [Blyttiomyces sp. JEL0837]